MKKVFFEEFVNRPILVYCNIAPKKMVNPIETCILDVRRKANLYFALLYLGSKSSRSLKIV